MQTIRLAGSEANPICGDLYLPRAGGPHPVVVGVPGGGWLRGDRRGLRHWGEYLADSGIAFVSIDYRRSINGAVFPGNAHDVAAAILSVAEGGAGYGLDPDRMALVGASAGAHLATLVALSDAFDLPPMRALVGVYGVYDLVDHWQADLVANAAPGTGLTERMIGCTPYDDQRRYFDASPICHVRYDNGLPTLLIWGDADRDVLPRQSEAMAVAMRQARFPLRTLVVPGAGHLWFSEDAIDDAHGYTAKVAPALRRFLHQHLGA